MTAGDVGHWLHAYFRCLGVILTFELTIRQAYWWVRMRHEQNKLKSTLLGYAVLHFTLFCFALFGLIFAPPVTRVAHLTMYLILDPMLLLAMFIAVIACWRISCGFAASRVAFECAERCALALAVLIIAQWSR